jgi:hypothetical protein
MLRQMNKLLLIILSFSISQVSMTQEAPVKKVSGFNIPVRQNYLSDKAEMFTEEEEKGIQQMADSIYRARKIRFQFLTVPKGYFMGDSLLFDQYAEEADKIWIAASDEFRVLFILCPEIKKSNLKMAGNFTIVGKQNVQQAISRSLKLKDAGEFTKADQQVLEVFSKDINMTVKSAGLSESKITGKYYEGLIAFMQLSCKSSILF